MKLNFLQLVQTTNRESGFSGATINSTQNQSGRAADVVRWVQEAHEEVQLKRPDWRHDWAQSSFPLVAGKDTYDPAADWGIAGGIRSLEREGAYVYRPATGLSSRLWLTFMEWTRVRQLAVPTFPGVPNVFSLKPDGTVFFSPFPQNDMTAVMEFWRHPLVLAQDVDVPRIPQDFHMAIVWRAVMKAADHTKDWARKDSAEENYQSFFTGMLAEGTPPYTVAGPLA